MKASIIVVGILGFVLVGGGSFYGGMQFEAAKAPSMRFTAGGFPDGVIPTGADTQNGRPGVLRGMAGGGVVIGEVLSLNDSTMTVKLPDGGSKIVFVSEATTVRTSEVSDKSAITVGEQVSVQGTTGTDGSVTATSIDIRSTLFEVRQ